LFSGQVAFALMFGPSIAGLIGGQGFALRFSGENAVCGLRSFSPFRQCFCSTSATIVSGAVAERMRYSSYLYVP
jgi:Amt family ammonium transporter